jgi:hypothetical protein
MERQPPATGPDKDERGETPLDGEADIAAAPLDPETVRMIRKSLDDPRPAIPAEEAFARVDARIAAYKAKHGL